MTDECAAPLITHRQLDLAECPDRRCGRPPEEHLNRLPCRWAWPYAHSRQHGGRTFPAGKCPSCTHIRRSGKPLYELEIA